MPDRVSTIRFKVEGTQQVTSKISELNREAVRQQRDLARSLSQAQKEQNGGVDPRDTIRRAQTDALRLGNIRGMMVKEQANLQERELASSRTQLANQARARAADYKKQQSEFSDLARVRLTADEKADRTVLSRRQKVNEAEHKLMASERQRVQKDRLADLNDFLGREDAKAKAFEDGQKKQARAESQAKRESMRGALSGFGGRMILGMATGRLAGDVLGPGAAEVGSIASGFMFGGPAVGAAVGAMEVIGAAISHTRERQEALTKSVQDYYSELAKTSVAEQQASKSALPITKGGADLEAQRFQVAAERAQKAEEYRRKMEHARTTWSGWFGEAFSMMNARQFLQEKGAYFADQKNLRDREETLNVYAAQRKVQDRIDKEDRAAAVQRAQIGTIPGFGRQVAQLEFEAKQAERKVREAAEEDLAVQKVHQEAAVQAALAVNRKADLTGLLAAQARDRVAIEQKLQDDLTAVRAEGVAKRQELSTDFIYSERSRTNPIYQLNDFALKLKEAVRVNATTMDEASVILSRKMGEVFGSLYHPGFAQVWDSRQRINIAALHPAQYPRIPAYADGTDNHPGGAALVGERGPELVHLPKGSAVVPFGPQAPKINTHAGFINGVAASKYYKAAPEGGLINGVRTDEMFTEIVGDPGSAYLRDPRHRSKSQEADLYGARLSRWTAPTGTGREMGNSKEFNEWAKSHPLHSYHPKAEVFGPPIPSAAKKAVAGVPSQYHKLFEDAPAGYYQSHGMVARARAAHQHRGAYKDLNHMIDPLTGRPLAVGSAMVGSPGGGAGPVSASQGQSADVAGMLQQIIEILRGGH